MQWVGRPYPSRLRRSRINSTGLVNKDSKTGAYRYRHVGYGGTPGWCYTFHLDVVSRSVYIYEIMIMSRIQRKLDCLKMNPRGATKEAPICAVPMHAPQTNSLWQGVGEVSSAGEVWCWRRIQPRLFVKACEGVCGGGGWIQTPKPRHTLAGSQHDSKSEYYWEGRA